MLNSGMKRIWYLVLLPKQEVLDSNPNCLAAVDFGFAFERMLGLRALHARKELDHGHV